MELATLEDRMMSAYDLLESSRNTLVKFANNTEEKRFALESGKAELILAGTIQGKNDSERNASARMLLHEQYAVLASAEQMQANARAVFENAERRVEYLRAMLRIAELTTPK